MMQKQAATRGDPDGLHPLASGALLVAHLALGLLEPEPTDLRRPSATTRGAGGVARARQPPGMPSHARLAGRTRLVALATAPIGGSGLSRDEGDSPTRVWGDLSPQLLTLRR